MTSLSPLIKSDPWPWPLFFRTTWRRASTWLHYMHVLWRSWQQMERGRSWPSLLEGVYSIVYWSSLQLYSLLLSLSHLLSSLSSHVLMSSSFFSLIQCLFLSPSLFLWPSGLCPPSSLSCLCPSCWSGWNARTSSWRMRSERKLCIMWCYRWYIDILISIFIFIQFSSLIVSLFVVGCPISHEFSTHFPLHFSFSLSLSLSFSCFFSLSLDLPFWPNHSLPSSFSLSLSQV